MNVRSDRGWQGFSQVSQTHLVAVAFDVHVTTERGTTRLTVVVAGY
ncbi:DUF7261 family protein [Salinirubrum litoreum]